MHNPITAGKVTHRDVRGFDPGAIDMNALRAYRYGRFQQQLRDNDCAAAVLIDPVNIRYAIDSRSMTVWLLHNMGRYCVVPAEGRAVLFEYPSKSCLTNPPRIPEISEVRPATAHAFLYVAEHAVKVSHQWAAEIRAVVSRLMGSGAQRLAIDRADLEGADALRAQGFTLVEGQRLVELARSVKSREEIACMRRSLDVAHIGMQRMRGALRPGMTETELWAELHYANIVNGGEWIETRLLCSGPRTNPWFQEASDRIIEPGDLVSFDTDMIGPYGYCSDVSRTFFCGNGRPSNKQRSLYALAVEQVEYNCALLRAGLSFRQYAEHAWPIPPQFAAQDYGCVAHGVGMVDEWPSVSCDPKDPTQMDGVFVPGMTICVESYIGEVGGTDGVKLEQQVLITETGHEILSLFPLEPKLR